MVVWYLWWWFHSGGGACGMSLCKGSSLNSFNSAIVKCTIHGEGGDTGGDEGGCGGGDCVGVSGVYGCGPRILQNPKLLKNRKKSSKTQKFKNI